MYKHSVRIRLGGADYCLRPTFEAIMDIEERLGGIVGLAVRAADGDFGLKEITVIIWACMEAKTEKRLPFEQVGALVLEAGIARASPVVRDLLTLCLTGLKPHDVGTD